MKEIDSIIEFRNIQLEILCSFDVFCREHNIKYSLAYGSLIGVIRHRGFIPWDDDIDLYMTRNEYIKLIETFPQYLNKKYKIACLERDEKWNRAYAKIYDCRTILIEQVRNNVGIGVGIDVFPLDEIPSEETLRRSYLKKMHRLRSFYTLKSLKLSRRRPLLKNIIIVVSRLLTWPISYRYLAEFISARAQQFNGTNTGYLFDNAEGYYSSSPFLMSHFDEYIDMPFEGHFFMVMSGWHDVLTKTFGNYMQLPPEEEQIPHHCFKAFRQ